MVSGGGAYATGGGGAFLPEVLGREMVLAPMGSSSSYITMFGADGRTLCKSVDKFCKRKGKKKLIN